MAETLLVNFNAARARYAFGNTPIEECSRGIGVPGPIVTGQGANLDEEFGRRDDPRRGGPAECSLGWAQLVMRFVVGRVDALENA
ncbi:MAG: hypothetical protein AAF501_09365 [Pseudomonadota bacterium]